jgi:hypothetical protein
MTNPLAPWRALLGILMTVAIAAPTAATASSVGSGPASPSAAAAPIRVAVGGSHERVALAARPHVVVRDLAKHGANPTRTIDHPALRRIPTPRGAAKQSASVRAPLAPGVLAPVPASTTSAPNAGLAGHVGLSAASPNEGAVDPPDPSVAVGPDHVVQVVNGAVRITSRASGTSVVADSSLRAFFGLPSYVTWNRDPRIAFDSVHRRWIATEVSWDCHATSEEGQAVAKFGHGFVDVAVSDSADPTRGWQPYGFQYVDRFPDDPGLGSSLDKVIANPNVYAMSAPASGQPDCVSGTFVGADFFVTDWADLVNGGGLSAAPSNPFPGTFGIRTGLQAPATENQAHWVAYADDGTGAYRFWADGFVNGTAHSGIETGGVAGDYVAPRVDPPAPRQPNGLVTSSIDGRLTDAVQQGNRLVVVSTYGYRPAADAMPRAAVRVTELAVGSSGTSVTQDFLVADDADTGFSDNYRAGIGLSATGTLHVVWTRSSDAAGDFPSSYTAYQRATDDAGSLSAPQRIATGVANHGDGTGSAYWGDNVGLAQDPQVPDAVWQGNEFASADGKWGTLVSQLQTTGLRYVPIQPVRALDTRSDVGLTGTFHANTARTFAIGGTTVDGVDIPSAVRAVTGNVTVVKPTASGYVALTPTATNNPSTSTINFPAGDVRANNLTAALGPGGRLSAVYRATSGATANLVFDVTGYYVDDATAATYTATAPARRLDTRKGIGLSGAFHANAARHLALAGSGSIPGAAVAISGNLTAVNQTAAGYASITTANPGANAPAVSNLNFPRRDVRANGVTVPLDAGGGIWLVYRGSDGATTDLVLDVTGYYTNDDAGATFHPLNPGRILDTRPGKILAGLTGKIQANTPVALDTDGHWGAPTGAKAVTGNLTATGETKAGYIAVTKDKPAGTPATSTINFPANETRANGITSALGSTGSLWLDFVSSTSGTSTDVILDLSGYFK